MIKTWITRLVKRLLRSIERSIKLWFTDRIEAGILGRELFFYTTLILMIIGLVHKVVTLYYEN